MTNVSEKKRAPGLVHLNIFHYDPAYDGSGLDPMGMSYIFPFTEDTWGAADELCNLFNSIAPGETYDRMFSTITPTGTPQEALYECSAAVKYSSHGIRTVAVEYLLPEDKMRELIELLPSWKQEIASTIWGSDIEIMTGIAPKLDEYFLGLL